MFEDSLLESSTKSGASLERQALAHLDRYRRGHLPGCVLCTAHGLGKRDEGDCDPVGDCGVWCLPALP